MSPRQWHHASIDLEVVPQMPDVFLSYSREDQPVARRFATGLEREGFSVWWDQSLNAGEAFDKVTEQALDEARAIVVLWSRKSVDSRWVRAEAMQEQARSRLVPVMIEACRRPIMFELTHTADLAGWAAV
ncbi:MAG: toll/interleukin-1 receptor domain-containing protein [Steroidobacteraceae bacterium]